jgi:hypothetical protein
MSEEVYVSFETAKLLKEKGFDWKTAECYSPHGGVYRFSYGIAEICGIEQYPMPTQQMACRWLREEHKIDISVTPDDGSWWIKVTELESWSAVFNGKVLNSDDIKYAYEGDTSTKEDCYEAALQYVLTNLI